MGLVGKIKIAKMKWDPLASISRSFEWSLGCHSCYKDSSHEPLGVAFGHSFCNK
jgi:hypothetical protein